MPNDESESDRLDMVHEMVLTMMHRKLFLAPIKSPQRVIDLGTGTGIWAIDFGMYQPRPDCVVRSYICLRLVVISRSIPFCGGKYSYIHIYLMSVRS